MKRRERGYFTLVGMLVVVAILVIVAAFYMGGPTTNERADKLGNSNLGRAVLKSRDHECRTNLGQVKSYIEMAHIEDRQVNSLQDLNAPGTILKCPIGGESYVLDVANQRVTCPHPGHENY
ncbi:MAG: hypothetical protein U0R49_11930 [Fimbriimonadales bacterium]